MYLIIYDITDPERLKKVAKIISRYGLRVQKSAFECDIDERHFKALWHQLESIALPKDKVFSYRQSSPKIQLQKKYKNI